MLTAQLAAIDAIRPGVTCEQVDRVARKIIAKAGFGRAFGHGLGHGTGLEIHEAPRLAEGQKTKLRAGNDRDGRTRNLPAGLGRRADRGRRAWSLAPGTRCSPTCPSGWKIASWRRERWRSLIGVKLHGEAELSQRTTKKTHASTANRGSRHGLNAASGPGDVFDVRKVRRFIELMNEHDLRRSICARAISGSACGAVRRW